MKDLYFRCGNCSRELEPDEQIKDGFIYWLYSCRCGFTLRSSAKLADLLNMHTNSKGYSNDKRTEN